MDKEYKVRIYIEDDALGFIVNMAIDCGMLELVNSFDGMNGILAIYDGMVSCDGVKELLSLGVSIFPLNKYEDYDITCPSCGCRVTDDMILLTYDENVLSGYNINCDDCGCQMALVKFKK